MPDRKITTIDSARKPSNEFYCGMCAGRFEITPSPELKEVIYCPKCMDSSNNTVKVKLVRTKGD